MPDVVYDAIFGATTLRQITNVNFDEGLEVSAARMSGNTIPSDHFIDGGNSKGELTTLDILGFLGLFGTMGARIDDGTGVKIPWHKRASGSTFASGSAHVNIVGNEDADENPAPVQITPRSVTAPRKGSATAQGEFMFLSPNGQVKPHVINVNQALASQLFQGQYGLGPVFINGDQVLRQVGYTINFGVGMSDGQTYDGGIWPSDCFIETADPTAEVQFEDFDAMADYTGGGAISSFVAYLRKKKSGNTYETDATTAHIKFSFAAGIITPRSMQAQDTKHGQATLLLTGRALTITTGVAIT